jgi:predicted transcriptional regulator of viral defense system
MLKDNQLISTQDVESAGIDRSVLTRMAAGKKLVRVHHGLYAKAETAEGYTFPAVDGITQMAALAVTPPLSEMLDRKRVVCLETAACLHHLTNKQIGTLYLAVPHGARIHRKAENTRAVQWTNKKMFEVGVEQMEINGHCFLITNKERTVIDLLRYSERSVFGDPILAREVLQKAVDSGISADDIMEVAQELGWEDRIRPYLFGAYRQEW